MKTTFFALLILITITSVYGQATGDVVAKDENNKVQSDSIPSKTTLKNTSGLPDEDFKILANKEFKKIIVSNTLQPVLGSSAILDIAKGELDLNGAVQTENGHVFSFGLKGGITDGTVPLFTNDEFNTNLSGRIQYHLLFRKKSIVYESETQKKYLKKLDEIKVKFDTESLIISSGTDISKTKAEIERLKLKKSNFQMISKKEDAKVKYQKELDEIKITEIRGKLKALKDKLETERDPMKRAEILYNISLLELDIDYFPKEIEKSNYLIDSLAIEQKKIEMDIAKLEEHLQRIESENNSIKLAKLQTKKNKDIQNLRDKLVLSDTIVPILGYKYKWLTFDYNVKFNGFKKFDTLSNTIEKENSVSQELGFSYSWYHLSPQKHSSWFLNFGVMVGIQDNFEDLSKVDITERTNYGVNPDDRYVEKKYNAYVGEYKKKLNYIAIENHTYWFLNFQNNSSAVHLFPEYVIKEDMERSANLGIGFMFLFKDKENSQSLVNAEIYLKLIDLKNNNDSELKLLKRSEFGLQFSVPIFLKPF